MPHSTAPGSAGPAGEAGPAGAAGEAGPAGSNGTNGTNGSAVLNGTADPTGGDGVNGDFWLRTDTNTLFGPKAAGAWPAGVSLVGRIPTVTKTTDYTLVLTDLGWMVEVNAATGKTVTIPANVFAAGDVVHVRQQGAGQVTVAPGALMTLRYASSLTTRAQYSPLTIHFRSATEAVVGGDAT